MEAARESKKKSGADKKPKHQAREHEEKSDTQASLRRPSACPFPRAGRRRPARRLAQAASTGPRQPLLRPNRLWPPPSSSSLPTARHPSNLRSGSSAVWSQRHYRLHSSTMRPFCIARASSWSDKKLSTLANNNTENINRKPERQCPWRRFAFALLQLLLLVLVVLLPPPPPPVQVAGKRHATSSSICRLCSR